MKKQSTRSCLASAQWTLMGWCGFALSAQAENVFMPNEQPSNGFWLLWAGLILLAAHWGLIVWLAHKLRQRTRASTEMDPLLQKTKFQLHREIARHESTEELLLETRDYLNGLINSIPTVIIGVTEDGYVTHWNSAAEQTVGLTSQRALGQKITHVVTSPEISIEQIRKTIAQQTPYMREAIATGNQTETRFTDLTIQPLVSPETQGAVILMQDVTLRVRVERSMIQNEKMLSLGQMAAGLAHEINNPLAAILSNVQTINRRFSIGLKANTDAANALGLELGTLLDYLERREIPKFIEAIAEAGERAGKIVKTMLEFSHAHNPEFGWHNLADVVDQSLDLAANTLDLKADNSVTMPFIIRDFSADLPAIQCSASEIQQVLLNLLLNAAHALQSAPSQDNPTITLRITREREFLRLEVRDNGPGMPEKVQKHIFEPFFTTKKVGSGTGLGLSVSYFIIREHHQGSIEVNSFLGKGTTFIIRLPIQQPVSPALGKARA